MLHHWPNLSSGFNDLSSKIGTLVSMQLKGIPQTVIILSSSNLPTVKVIALLQGNASTQCENRHTITRMYL